MKVFIIITTLALLTSFASAQEVNEKSLAEASELIEIMELRTQISTSFEAAMQPMLEPMIEQMNLNPAQVTELSAIFTNWWENDIDQESIILKYSTLYASTFTLKELTGLKSFYQTPLGKKVLMTMPQLTQKGMEIGMTAAQEKQPQLTAKIEAFLASIAADKE